MSDKELILKSEIMNALSHIEGVAGNPETLINFYEQAVFGLAPGNDGLPDMAKLQVLRAAIRISQEQGIDAVFKTYRKMSETIRGISES